MEVVVSGNKDQVAEFNGQRPAESESMILKDRYPEDIQSGPYAYMYPPPAFAHLEKIRLLSRKISRNPSRQAGFYMKGHKSGIIPDYSADQEFHLLDVKDLSRLGGKVFFGSESFPFTANQ
jgi:hypothetical protein